MEKFGSRNVAHLFSSSEALIASSDIILPMGGVLFYRFKLELFGAGSVGDGSVFFGIIAISLFISVGIKYLQPAEDRVNWVTWLRRGPIELSRIYPGNTALAFIAEKMSGGYRRIGVHTFPKDENFNL